MLAKAKRDMRAITPDGRTYELEKDKEYYFYNRGDDSVVFTDKDGLEIVYSNEEFNEDFLISQI